MRISLKLTLLKFHDSLQECLTKLTMLDACYRIQWSYRRLKDIDSSESLGLRSPLNRHAITLVIEVTQIENNVQRRSDILPTYDSVQRDMVLDIGPPVAMEECLTLPPPVYRRHEHSLPPSYRSALQPPSIDQPSPAMHASQPASLST